MFVLQHYMLILENKSPAVAEKQRDAPCHLQTFRVKSADEDEGYDSLWTVVAIDGAQLQSSDGQEVRYEINSMYQQWLIGLLGSSRLTPHAEWQKGDSPELGVRLQKALILILKSNIDHVAETVVTSVPKISSVRSAVLTQTTSVTV